MLIQWLRTLAETGGKGVVISPDARALGRVADRLELLEDFHLEVFKRVPGRPPFGVDYTDAFKVKTYNALRDYLTDTILKESIR